MDELAKQQAAGQMAQGLISGANILGGPSREKTQTIVDFMVGRHQGQLAAWSYLQRALEAMPPSEAEEASLWELVSSMRHQRY
jgi:hypothetical protein